MMRFSNSELQLQNPGLASLRTLLSGIPVPREGEDEDGEELIVAIVPPPPPPEPTISQHWSSLLATLNKLHGEGMILDLLLNIVPIQLIYFKKSSFPFQISKRYMFSPHSVSLLFVVDVYVALQEVEHLSSRKPSVLEMVTDAISELILSPQGNIRSLAHSLLARALKYRPASNANILAAFHRCLESPRADVLMSALDRLPDIVVCMQGKDIDFACNT